MHTRQSRRRSGREQTITFGGGVVLPVTQPEMGALAANPEALPPHQAVVVNLAPVVDLFANK